VIGYVVIERSKPGGGWDVLDCSFSEDREDADALRHDCEQGAQARGHRGEYAVARVEKDET
jgi:hypothetical protein